MRAAPQPCQERPEPIVTALRQVFDLRYYSTLEDIRRHYGGDNSEAGGLRAHATVRRAEVQPLEAATETRLRERHRELGGSSAQHCSNVFLSTNFSVDQYNEEGKHEGSEHTVGSQAGERDRLKW